MESVLGPVAAALGIGLALAGAPGPVQAILLTESVRGLGRGLRAMLGAYGVRRIGDDRALIVRRALAVLLGVLGVWLVVSALVA